MNIINAQHIEHINWALPRFYLQSNTVLPNNVGMRKSADRYTRRNYSMIYRNCLEPLMGRLILLVSRIPALALAKHDVW